MRKSRLKLWLWALGTLGMAIVSAIIGAFKRGERQGRAGQRYKDDLERADEILKSGDTKRMRDDLTRPL